MDLTVLRQHAQRLSETGIGDWSQMCAGSLIAEPPNTPNFPQEFADEGIRFANMARAITPPELVAEYTRRVSGAYPPLIQLGDECTEESFKYVIRTTRAAGVTPGSELPMYQHPQLYTTNYLRHCQDDPSLLLACFCLSAVLRSFAHGVGSHVTNRGTQLQAHLFAEHYNSINLVGTLPVALSASLIKLRGKESKVGDIDSEVILDALNFLRENGAFIAHIEGKTTSSIPVRAKLQCPMQGYLFELLAHTDTFLTLTDALSRADRELATLAGTESEDGALRICLRTHSANRLLIQRYARQALELF